MENNCKLSEGAENVLALMKSEPLPNHKHRDVDVNLAEELESVIDNSDEYTRESMPWLNGLYISLDKMHAIYALVNRIKNALEEGAKYEDSFWNGVADSQKARNSFIETLLKSVESGKISFNDEKNADQDPDTQQ